MEVNTSIPYSMKSRKALSAFTQPEQRDGEMLMVAGVSALRRRPPTRKFNKSVTIGLSLDERAPRSLASRAVSGNKGTSRFDIGKT